MSDSSDQVAEPYVMNGGEGAFSYAKNSYFQKATTSDLKAMVDTVIADHLEITDVSDPIRVADLGCSVGPNTFQAMQNVVEAVQSKLSKSNPGIMPGFQVFFCDHTSNDFNTLFMSLPPERPYYAAGVPGSFYGRLFPDSSLHFVYSSYALQWLSEVPEGLVNKGRVHCTNAGDNVCKAYATRYRTDMSTFLMCRAKEMAVGGVMVLMMPAKPDGVPLGKIPICVMYELLGLSLMDMAKEGKVTEAQVDSFNLPLYITSPSEIMQLVETNAGFEIVNMELLNTLSRYGGQIRGREIVMHLRAGLEGLISVHFGSGIIDELFDRLARKTEGSGSLVDMTYSKGNLMFLVLKRK
ncbi:hypothetical protein MLD38_005433 [Melastoma candidum]|uniref:Uncharacterized protein n=1 Tax=Melastoma candidum TaxID=119954 RepID=A0ACB9RJC6_9MYRT|nr:hypothetical protein MLD38_005433 [Melastoma candidum]